MDDGGFTGTKDAKSLTAVWECDLLFVILKPLNIFDKEQQRFTIYNRDTTG